MKKTGLLMVAIFILVCGLSITAKAASWKEESLAISPEQYCVMEQEYLKEVREILLEKGCKNAGVVLTYTIDIDGNRNYTITIHHIKLDKMSDQDRVLLQARIQESAWEVLLAEVTLKQL